MSKTKYKSAGSGYTLEYTKDRGYYKYTIKLEGMRVESGRYVIHERDLLKYFYGFANKHTQPGPPS